MIYVDGAQKSGSGTIVRFAIGLATLLGEELCLTNIRAKREKPRLRPQHLKASEYRIPRLTEHVETNLWLVESILGAKTEVNRNLVKIQGIGYYPYKEEKIVKGIICS